MNRKHVFPPLLLLCSFLMAAVPQTTTVSTIERYDTRLDRLLPTGTVVEKIADGFTWLEGPIWNRKEQFLLFSDIPNNSVFQWKEGIGTKLFLKPSGYTGREPFSGKEPGSNGLTYDPQGRLILCEHGDRRIGRLEPDGTKTTVADRYQGKRLNSPNDAVYSSAGDLYFTDPPFGLPGAFDDPARELDFCGVFMLPGNGELTLLTREVKAPNGIAFSPDEKRLYITDVDPNRSAWLVFDVVRDGGIANGRVFHDATPYKKNRKGGPDGLKADREGNLFAAGPGGLYIFAPDATLLGFVDLGVPTANCNWGNDGSVLYITADTAVYRVRTNTKGSGW